MKNFVKNFESYILRESVYENLGYIEELLKNVAKRVEDFDIEGWAMDMFEYQHQGLFMFDKGVGIMIVANPFDSGDDDFLVGIDTGSDFFKDEKRSFEKLSELLVGELGKDSDTLVDLIRDTVSDIGTDDNLRDIIIEKFGSYGELGKKDLQRILRIESELLVKFLIESGTNPLDMFDTIDDMLTYFGYPDDMRNVPWLLKHLPAGRQKDIIEKIYSGKTMFGV